MNPFDYRQAENVEDAVSTVSADPDAAYLAGGTNLVDHLKLGVARPDLLVDVSRLPLEGIEPLSEGGLRVGANVLNSDLAADPTVREQYPVLTQALVAGASGQLRNRATTGGNLLQRTRCVYFHDTSTPCNKREPGTGCSALEGWNRYHAILGASQECIAVHPSDMAVAMTALDAVVIVSGSTGERRIPVAELHRLPAEHPEDDTVLSHGDLIVGVEIPHRAFFQRSRYRKARDRASFAFALVSVAACLDIADHTVRDVRLTLGGVAHKPWRAERAEEALRGGPPTAQAFTDAADAELAEARPQPGNAFKVSMARRMVVSVLTELAS